MTDSSDRGREVLRSTAGEERGWKLRLVRRYNFIGSAHQLRSPSKNHSCGRRSEEVGDPISPCGDVFGERTTATGRKAEEVEDRPDIAAQGSGQRKH